MTWRIQAFALLALAAALLWPTRARAAILPVCERDEVVTVQPPPPEPVCEVVTTVDDVTGVVTKAAPICDPRGASAVAPQRVLPVADARIEARPSCSSDDLSVAFVPRSDEAPPSSASALALEPALPGQLGAVPWSGYVDGHDFLEPDGAARAGVRRQVDRPPR